MSEINILSVDFDWIMEPSINMYNDHIRGSTTIDEILKNNPGIVVKPDIQKFYTLFTLINVISNWIDNPNHFVIADNHQEIVDTINTKWDIQDKYTLYNIDHHHDCGYDVKTLEDIDNQNVQCGNWVHWIKNLDKYIWINNKNSDTFMTQEIFYAIPKYQMSYDINLIRNVKFDYLFLCLSPGWTPKEFWPLFDTISFNIKEVIIPKLLISQEDFINANAIHSAGSPSDIIPT